MYSQLLLPEAGTIAPIVAMPTVYYVFWPTESKKWRFMTPEDAEEFRTDHDQGWDMTVAAREEDEPIDARFRPEASDG